jgi:type I site-specific restriction endonuclease
LPNEKSDKYTKYIQMRLLNLPLYDIKVTEKDGKKYIYDSFRRKNVALTPEEWVRQHFVNYLVTSKSYPPERIANEVAIHLNGTSKRCDTVVYDDYMEPLLIIEYKAPEIAITKDVFDQISRYNSALKVPYLIVSNGLAHYCCNMDYVNMKCDFLKEIPAYTEVNRKRT